METITFFFPGHARTARGGNKVIYEYANRLVSDGYKIHIVYAGSLFWAQKSLRFKLSACVRYVQYLLQGYSARRWFDLDKRVHEHWTFSLNYRHVPKSDVYVCTSPYTAMYLNDYPIETTRKFYFIQDYENWGNVTDEMLRTTYHYPLQNIVISGWLQRIMDEEDVECKLIPNGFDFSYFKMNIPIEQKDKYRITMLNHFMERKGCKYGFEALKKVKRVYPRLRVNLFGTELRPEGLPEWYDYYQSPNREIHNHIYNEAAIFLGTSSVEGWGLTIGEAMICGQAVVCTDIPGYREMVEDEKSALLSPIKDSEGLAKNIIRLIEDDELRYRIARNGHQHIQRFTWEDSYKNLVKAFGLD